jgi:hypothetical protein
VLVSGAFGEGNKGLHSYVRELAVSGTPRLQAKLGLDPGAAAARIRRVAYERIGLAIARGHAQQLRAAPRLRRRTPRAPQRSARGRRGGRLRGARSPHPVGQQQLSRRQSSATCSNAPDHSSVFASRV